MPGGDRTGPAGMGPMTGRAAGYCAGYPVPGYMNPAYGRGYGFGIGRGGRGRRNWFYATGLPGWQRAAYGYPAWGGYVQGAPPYGYTQTPYGAPGMPSKEQEIEMLKSQAENLQNALGQINKRIEELEAEEPSK